MKRVILFLAFFLFFFLFIDKNYSYALSCAAGAGTCKTIDKSSSTAPCPSEWTTISTVSKCGIGSVCCKSTTAGDGDGVGTGTGWGSFGTGPSLWEIKNLLGSNAPANASTASVNSIIGLFISLLIIAAIILSLFFLIWGGFDWIMSGGNKQKLEQARQKILYAIIGLIVVLIAFFIINVIGKVFGVNPLKS